MATIREVSPQDPISQRALDGLEETAPILTQGEIEFYTRDGDQDRVQKAGDSSDTELFRSQNTDNSPTPRSNDYADAVKKILSYDAEADVILEDRNRDPEEELTDQTYLESRERGYIFQNKIFEADSATNADEFDGMRVQVPSGHVIEPDDKIVMPLGGDSKKQAQQEAIEEILKFFERVPGGAQVAYVNNFMKIRLLAIAKSTGFYGQSKDELGDTIDMVGDTIIRGAGRKKDGSSVLPFSESFTDSSSTTHTNTSSIFACRWAERADLTMLTSVGLKGRYAGQSGNMITTNLNMDAQLVLQDDNALWQKRGFALSA